MEHVKLPFTLQCYEILARRENIDKTIAEKVILMLVYEYVSLHHTELQKHRLRFAQNSFLTIIQLQ